MNSTRVLLFLVFLSASFLFAAEPAKRIYVERFDPANHPDRERYAVTPPDWSVFGNETKFICCRGIEIVTDPERVADQCRKLCYKFTDDSEYIEAEIKKSLRGTLVMALTIDHMSGKQIEEFGSPTLSVGGSKRWTGDWKVTQDQLDAGKVVFQVRYSYYEGSGDGESQLIKKGKNFSKKITFTGADPEVSVTRTITPTTAQKGQEVSVVYEIANTGSVDVTSVNIKENASISSKSGTIDSIAAGATGTYTFTAVMGSKDLTSNATVSYKAGGKTFTTKVESATVKYGEVNLSATLKADKKGGAPGDSGREVDLLRGPGLSAGAVTRHLALSSGSFLDCRLQIASDHPGHGSGDGLSKDQRDRKSVV